MSLSEGIIGKLAAESRVIYVFLLILRKIMHAPGQAAHKWVSLRFPHGWLDNG